MAAAKIYYNAYTEAEDETVRQYITKLFGNINAVLYPSQQNDIKLGLCLIEPEPKRNFYTLVTLGMGANKMNSPASDSKLQAERIELAISLPPTWDIFSSDDRWVWPLSLMHNIARMPLNGDVWFGWGHTIKNSKPFADNTSFDAIMLISPEKNDSALCTLPNGDIVNFYQMVPLYADEIEFRSKYGPGELIKRMGKNSNFVVDINRPHANMETPVTKQ